MNNKHIIHSTNHAIDILSSNQTASVHSVYENTVNIQTGGHILALQTYNTVISPISLIADTRSFDIAQGCEIIFKDGCIFAGNTCFDWSKADIIDCNMHKNALNIQADTIKAAVSKADFASFNAIFCDNIDFKNNFLILNAAKNRIENCTHELSNKNYQNAANELSCLIGLGIGLTPSGDDFLCGVLAGLIFCGLTGHCFSEILKQKINERLQNTNDISRAFLTCALNDNFSSPVLNMHTLVSADKIYNEFKKIGHSSGIDTLCGIYYCLNTICHELKKDA